MYVYALRTVSLGKIGHCLNNVINFHFADDDEPMIQGFSDDEPLVLA